MLLGPRQTGKSTLVKTLNPDLSINLAFEQVFLDYSAQPGLIEKVILRERPKTIFIDEVQRIPSLLNTVQGILDENPRRHRFYLTGSSARKLKRGKANLLPGRVVQYQLGPLIHEELGDDLEDDKRFKFKGVSPYIARRYCHIHKCVLCKLGRPPASAAFLVGYHQLQAFGPTFNDSVEREGGGFIADDGAVEEFAVGGPARVVDRDLGRSLWMFGALPRVSTFDASPNAVFARLWAGRRRRTGPVAPYLVVRVLCSSRMQKISRVEIMASFKVFLLIV